jgi:hypothetical protein
MSTVTIKEIVKNNKAVFTHYRAGNLYYDIVDGENGNKICSVPVDLENKEDIGNASYGAEMKAMYLMRYITKAQKEDSLTFYK